MNIKSNSLKENYDFLFENEDQENKDQENKAGKIKIAYNSKDEVTKKNALLYVLSFDIFDAIINNREKTILQLGKVGAFQRKKSYELTKDDQKIYSGQEINFNYVLDPARSNVSRPQQFVNKMNQDDDQIDAANTSDVKIYIDKVKEAYKILNDLGATGLKLEAKAKKTFIIKISKAPYDRLVSQILQGKLANFLTKSEGNIIYRVNVLHKALANIMDQLAKTSLQRTQSGEAYKGSQEKVDAKQKEVRDLERTAVVFETWVDSLRKRKGKQALYRVNRASINKFKQIQQKHGEDYKDSDEYKEYVEIKEKTFTEAVFGNVGNKTKMLNAIRQSKFDFIIYILAGANFESREETKDPNRKYTSRLQDRAFIKLLEMLYGKTVSDNVMQQILTQVNNFYKKNKKKNKKVLTKNIRKTKEYQEIKRLLNSEDTTPTGQVTEEVSEQEQEQQAQETEEILAPLTEPAEQEADKSQEASAGETSKETSDESQEKNRPQIINVAALPSLSNLSKINNEEEKNRKLKQTVSVFLVGQLYAKLYDKINDNKTIFGTSIGQKIKLVDVTNRIILALQHVSGEDDEADDLFAKLAQVSNALGGHQSVQLSLVEALNFKYTLEMSHSVILSLLGGMIGNLKDNKFDAGKIYKEIFAQSDNFKLNYGPYSEESSQEKTDSGTDENIESLSDEEKENLRSSTLKEVNKWINSANDLANAYKSGLIRTQEDKVKSIEICVLLENLGNSITESIKILKLDKASKKFKENFEKFKLLRNKIESIEIDNVSKAEEKSAAQEIQAAESESEEMAQEIEELPPLKQPAAIEQEIEKVDNDLKDLGSESEQQEPTDKTIKLTDVHKLPRSFDKERINEIVSILLTGQLYCKLIGIPDDKTIFGMSAGDTTSLNKLLQDLTINLSNSGSKDATKLNKKIADARRAISIHAGSTKTAQLSLVEAAGFDFKLEMNYGALISLLEGIATVENGEFNAHSVYTLINNGAEKFNIKWGPYEGESETSSMSEDELENKIKESFQNIESLRDRLLEMYKAYPINTEEEAYAFFFKNISNYSAVNAAIHLFNELLKHPDIMKFQGYEFQLVTSKYSDKLDTLINEYYDEKSKIFNEKIESLKQQKPEGMEQNVWDEKVEEVTPDLDKLTREEEAQAEELIDDLPLDSPEDYIDAIEDQLDNLSGILEDEPPTLPPQADSEQSDLNSKKTTIQLMRPILRKNSPKFEDSDNIEDYIRSNLDTGKIEKRIVQDVRLCKAILGKFFNKDILKLSKKKRGDAAAQTIHLLISYNILSILHEESDFAYLKDSRLDEGLRDIIRSARRGVDAIGSLGGASSTKLGQGFLNSRPIRWGSNISLVTGLIGSALKLTGITAAAGVSLVPLLTISTTALASYASYKFVKACGDNIKREGGLFHKNPRSYVRKLLNDKETSTMMLNSAVNIANEITRYDRPDVALAHMNFGRPGDDAKDTESYTYFNSYFKEVQDQRESLNNMPVPMQNALKQKYSEAYENICANTHLEKLIGPKNLTMLLNEVFLILGRSGEQPRTMFRNRNIIKNAIVDAALKHRDIAEGVVNNIITDEINKADQGKFANIDFSKKLGASDDNQADHAKANLEREKGKEIKIFGKTFKYDGKGFLSTIGGKAQRDQILDLADFIMNNIAKEISGLSFDKYLEVYGDKEYKDMKLENALHDMKLSYLFEDDSQSPTSSRRQNVASGTVETAATGLLGLAGSLYFLERITRPGSKAAAAATKASAPTGKEVLNAACTPTSQEAIAAAAKEQDTFQATFQYVGPKGKGFELVTYNSNLDANVGTPDAVSGWYVRIKEMPDGSIVREKAEFVGHGIKRFLRYIGNDMARGGIDMQHFQKTGEIIAKAGAKGELLTDPNVIMDSLTFAYEKGVGTAKASELASAIAEMNETAETYKLLQTLPAKMAGVDVPEPDGKMLKLIEFSIEKQKETLTKGEWFQSLDPKAKAQAIDQLNAGHQAALEKAFPSMKVAIADKPSAEALEAVRNGTSVRMKIDSSTTPSSQDGIVFAKADVDWSEIWLKTAGLTKLGHNLMTYFTRKKVEPKEVRDMFVEMFDPVRVVLVSLYVGILGGKLEGSRGGGAPMGDSDGLDGFGDDSSDDTSSTPDTLAAGKIYNTSLSDFLFEGKKTNKRFKKESSVYKVNKDLQDMFKNMF